MKKKATLKQKIGKLLIPKLPITRENFDIVRFEINAGLISLNKLVNPSYINHLKRLKTQTNLSVNIGAGPFGKDGWVNIDTVQLPNITLVYDCRKTLPFANESVDRIRCEHVLEHLDIKDEVPKFIAECFRCLSLNGVLRIIVPDLELFVNAYCSKNNEEWKKLGFDLTNLSSELATPMGILNFTFRQNGEHKFGYDFDTLQKTVCNYGFKDVRKMSWGTSIDPLLEDDQPNHRPYSLYVDCIKS